MYILYTERADYDDYQRRDVAVSSDAAKLRARADEMIAGEGAIYHDWSHVAWGSAGEGYPPGESWTRMPDFSKPGTTYFSSDYIVHSIEVLE